eukprot:CAMPEP_0169110026 /NCGR_PEP_ID=MMETSP1015-20121227/26284_1 /TAXON_ID=342587 /ORGANISM="Karlodinium micrum, Strain CCMP2283" /LENGTH=40 /DNA_ID= /DNA_START= /DNA_END= /DNA_ORIENTATION=
MAYALVRTPDCYADAARSNKFCKRQRLPLIACKPDTGGNS